MTREELLEKKKKLEANLASINEELDRLDDMIRKEKVKELCNLLEELWKQTDEEFEIENYDGDDIMIDFEDLFYAIKRHFDI